MAKFFFLQFIPENHLTRHLKIFSKQCPRKVKIIFPPNVSFEKYIKFTLFNHDGVENIPKYYMLCVTLNYSGDK